MPATARQVRRPAASARAAASIRSPPTARPASVRITATPWNWSPAGEIALEKATPGEAEEYRQFVAEYSQYWRQYFDPIAIRVQITPRQYRAETIILPLIDNSIYTGMAMALGGEPEPLDALPVPQANIFSAAVRVNKEELLKQPADVRHVPRHHRSACRSGRARSRSRSSW